MKVNWDKILWSWPVQILNIFCFVFMLFVFADGCREIKEVSEQKETQRIINIIKASK